MALCLYGTSRASAAPHHDPGVSSIARVLPAAASEAAPGAHGVTQLSSTLPLTGTDALVLVGFAGAVLVPGIGLTIVSRRQRRGAHMA
jgi:hypothetical protein